MGHTARQFSRSRRDVSAAAQSQRWMWFRDFFEGSMSDPSPTRHRFKAGNTRRARLRVEVAAIRTGIVVLAHAVLIGNAIAATEYAVEGRNARLWQCLLLPLSLALAQIEHRHSAQVG